MDEKILNDDVFELDLQRLADAMINHAWRIGIVAVLFAVITLLGTLLFVAPKYESAVMFYVDNYALSYGEASPSTSSSDIAASKSLVDTCIVILETRETLNEVIDASGVDRTEKQLRKMISAESVEETEILEVVVTAEDPVEAEKIADAIAYILPARISAIIDGGSAKVVDAAVLPMEYSSPDYIRNIILGFAIGFILSVIIVLCKALQDNRIYEEKEISEILQYPVLAAIPDMNDSGERRMRYCGHGVRALRSKKDGEKALVGKGIPFAAAESYRLLRTKLMFSFADNNCHVIGISGVTNTEGKTISAVNLAYGMSQLDQRVLLVDCDLRCPTVSKKLSVEDMPGLTDYLTGRENASQIIQICGIEGEERGFHVISAGRIPPNPIELLSSEEMETLIKDLRGEYDYIFLDLPPVETVCDALVATKYTDGVLLVVRQRHCDRTALSNAVRQFEFVGAKILGVVFNCVSAERIHRMNGYYRNCYNGYMDEKCAK